MSGGERKPTTQMRRVYTFLGSEQIKIEYF